MSTRCLFRQCDSSLGGPRASPRTTRLLGSYFALTRAGGEFPDSLYLETHLPLVSAQNSFPAVELFEVMLAARRDYYRIVGTNIAYSFPGGTAPDPPTSIERDVSSTDPTLG